MLAGGPALAKNGCFSSSAAVARCAGSRTSRRSRKPFRDGDTCGGGRARSECQPHCSLAVGASVASSLSMAGIYCPGREERGALCLELGPTGFFPPDFQSLGGAGRAGPCRHPSPQKRYLEGSSQGPGHAVCLQPGQREHLCGLRRAVSSAPSECHPRR